MAKKYDERWINELKERANVSRKQNHATIKNETIKSAIQHIHTESSTEYYLEHQTTTALSIE